MKIIKIIFDYSLAILMLIIFIIPLFILALLVFISTKDNAFFRQKRVGRNGVIFYIYKLRTMKGEYQSSITTSKMKITSLGKFLRKYKLDELPQIYNILKGEMSWVGPRPDVLGYADKLQGEDRMILTVKPGITGPAQIKYKDEEQILSEVSDPVKYNDEVIWKDKVEINKEYVKKWTFYKDIKYLLKTIFS